MKMKKILSALLVGIILCTSIVETPALAAPRTNAVSWPSGPNPGKLSSDSAIVMEISTGMVLYEKKSHKKHYPASITKILTAMIAIENSSLSETVTFSEKAIYETEANSSTVLTEVGEKMTMEQCLYAILLASANEVCRGVAEHVSGTIPAFVKKMNAKVKELGLKGTHFNNPNGLPDPNHYTTAHDMAVIARTAFQNSTFRKICGTKNYTCAKTNKHKTKRIWSNHHQMVNAYQWPKYEYRYATGGKTGYTIAAGSTLVTFAEKDGMQLVCVIMKATSPKSGEPNEYTDSTALLNYGFEKYKKHTINGDSTKINEDLFNNYGSYFNAEESPVHLSSESSVVLPKGVKLSRAKQKISYKKNVKITAGDNVIGQVTYTYGGKTVGTTDIIYTVSSVDNHLDEASRNIVNSEIEEIETTNQNTKNKNKRFQKMKSTIGGVFDKTVTLVRNNLSVVLIVLGVLLLLVFFFQLVRTRRNRQNSSRLTRGSGGYRSRGARKQHAKQMRAQRRNASGSDKSRHKRSRRYKPSRSYSSNPATAKRKKKNGLQYHKRHKKTKESFGKNFFDF